MLPKNVAERKNLPMKEKFSKRHLQGTGLPLISHIPALIIEDSNTNKGKEPDALTTISTFLLHNDNSEHCYSCLGTWTGEQIPGVHSTLL